MENQTEKKFEEKQPDLSRSISLSKDRIIGNYKA
jgi:hypothetical protein